MKNGIITKSEEEIEVMLEGGQKLARVKKALKKAVAVGVSAKEIEDLATKLIKKEGGEPSFKLVPNYRWATCVNVNEGVVHGIPKKELIFKNGDIVSIDVGMYYKGFNTDTSFSLLIGNNRSKKSFLEVGKKALEAAILSAIIGNKIFDISMAIESTLRQGGYSPVRALVGHGVGRSLHEEPEIPCFTNGERTESPVIEEGAVLAIEVMYSEGSGDVKIDKDGWTISTSDGTIAGLFEETVAITKNGPKVLTR